MITQRPVWKSHDPTFAAVQEAYRDKEHRPTIVALIRDGEGRLLLVQAERNAEWGVVQGGIDETESPRDALAREILEEIGAAPSLYVPSRFIGCADIDAAPGSADGLRFPKGVRYFIFEVAYRGPEALTLQAAELSDYAWLAPSAVAAKLLQTREEKRIMILEAFRRAGRISR